MAKKLRSSSICLKVEVVFNLPKNSGGLPYALKVEVVFQFSFYFTPVSLLRHHSLRNAENKLSLGRVGGGGGGVVGLTEIKAKSAFKHGAQFLVFPGEDSSHLSSTWEDEQSLSSTREDKQNLVPA